MIDDRRLLFMKINALRNIIRENNKKNIELISKNQEIESKIFIILRQNNYFKLDDSKIGDIKEESIENGK